MTWTWRFIGESGEPVTLPADYQDGVSFPSQSDAETWIGENWKDLLADGVEAVSLYDGESMTYGPMSLKPA